MDNILQSEGLYYISRQIFEHLGFEDLKSASKVSKLWNEFLMKERSLWMPHFLRTERFFVNQICGDYQDMYFMDERDTDDDLMEDFIDYLQKEGSTEEIIAMTELMRFNVWVTPIPVRIPRAKTWTEKLFENTYLYSFSHVHPYIKAELYVVRWDNVTLFKAYLRLFNKDLENDMVLLKKIIWNIEASPKIFNYIFPMLERNVHTLYEHMKIGFENLVEFKMSMVALTMRWGHFEGFKLFYRHIPHEKLEQNRSQMLLYAIEGKNMGILKAIKPHVDLDYAFGPVSYTHLTLPTIYSV